MSKITKDNCPALLNYLPSIISLEIFLTEIIFFQAHPHPYIYFSCVKFSSVLVYRYRRSCTYRTLGQTDIWTDRHLETDIWTDRHLDRQTFGQTDRHLDRQTFEQTDIWTDRQTFGQTDRHLDRQTDRVIPLYPTTSLLASGGYNVNSPNYQPSAVSSIHP